MYRRADLPPDIATRALAALLREILASGRKPLDATDMPDAVAVHDLRKALKRWRAILRLVAPVIGEEAERLRIESRDLAREVATARDGRAALEALADIGDLGDLGEDGATLSARSRATIGERLAQIGASAEAASLTLELKARVRDALAHAASAVERWPIERFDTEEATRQLTETYRRACGAIPPDWSAASLEDLHRLRRRVVEHRYQMELVDLLWPRLIKVWIAEAQRLRDRLGAYHDLALLARLAEPHQPLAPWRSRLNPLITARQAVHAAAAKRLAGRLFAETPKAFRRRLIALWKHRAAT
jgi:CHAD domain-containing protein